MHDLGGREGFGPVDVEPDEPVFHAEWEGRVFGSMMFVMAAAGAGTPRFRHAIERMDPAHYLTSSYYEHWLTAAATLLVEAGVVSASELEAGAGAFPLAQPALATGADVERLSIEPGSARFAVGDAVRVLDDVFSGHTRCPAYVRGRSGIVTGAGPVANVPELEAHLGHQVGETTYRVRFDASQLWPGNHETAHSVTVDLYEHHLVVS